MKGKAFFAFSMLMISAVAVADDQAKPLMKCGPFTLSSSYDGFMHINNVRPQSQKFRFLGAKDDYNNLSYQWMVQRSDAPGWFGMDYVKRNGKAILNVESIRNNMDQPRIFGSFDCVKI